MKAKYDWRIRHAGFMAIAAIGEGTGKLRFGLLVRLFFMNDIPGDAKRIRKNCQVGFFSLRCAW